MLSRIKVAKLRLIGGIGCTLPMQVAAINRGWKPHTDEVEVAPIPADYPLLSQHEEAELVEQINSNPNLQPTNG